MYLTLVENWSGSYRKFNIGGGNGAVQFLLDKMGYDVTKVDFSPAKPVMIVADRFRIIFGTLPSPSIFPISELDEPSQRNHD